MPTQEHGQKVLSEARALKNAFEDGVVFLRDLVQAVRIIEIEAKNIELTEAQQKELNNLLLPVRKHIRTETVKRLAFA